MGDYGEPWERRSSDSTVRAYGGQLMTAKSGNESTDRIVDCVNALAGIKDPQAFVEAAKAYCDSLDKIDLAFADAVVEDDGRGSSEVALRVLVSDSQDKLGQMRAASGSGTPKTDTTKGGE